MQAYADTFNTGLTLDGDTAKFLLAFVSARVAIFGRGAAQAYVQFGSARTRNAAEVTEEDVSKLYKTLEGLVLKRQKAGRPLFAKRCEQDFFGAAAQHLAYLHAVRKIFPGWDKALEDERSKAVDAAKIAKPTPETEQPEAQAGGDSTA